MIQLTKEGYENLKKELKKLETTERKKIAKRLKDAIAEGDLSENAAYTDAKETQSRIEGKILEIKQTLSSAVVVKNIPKDKIGVGVTFKVQTPDGKKRIFKLTGSADSNPSEGKISYDSLLGGAFLNHRVEDVIKIETPVGEMIYKILEII